VLRATPPGPFATVLRHIGSPEMKLIEQAPDGTLMLGAAGEAIVQSRDFFAVFETRQEWRLASGGRTLGTLPISFPVHIDNLVVSQAAGGSSRALMRARKPCKSRRMPTVCCP
jgi:hypothetical protein